MPRFTRTRRQQSGCAVRDAGGSSRGAFLMGHLRVDGAAMRREADGFFGTEDRGGGEDPWGREGD